MPPEAPTVPVPRIHPQEMGIGDSNRHQSSAHNAERVALDESTRPPVALQIRANEPEREHVEEYVAEACVQQ